MFNITTCCITSSRKKARSLYNFSGEYIYANTNFTPKNHYVCNRMANELVTSSFKTVLLLHLSLVHGVGAPLYKIFFTNEKETLLPVILPFIDPETKYGFYINLAYQYVSCLCGFFILPRTELLLCEHKNTFLSYAAIVENDITGFGCQLNKSVEFSYNHRLMIRSNNCQFSSIFSLLDLLRTILKYTIGSSFLSQYL